VPLREVGSYPLAFLRVSVNHILFEQIEVCIENNPA